MPSPTPSSRWLAPLVELERRLHEPVVSPTAERYVEEWLAANPDALGDAGAVRGVLTLLDDNLGVGDHYRPLLEVAQWPAATVGIVRDWVVQQTEAPWCRGPVQLELLMRLAAHLDDDQIEQVLDNYLSHPETLREHLVQHGVPARFMARWLAHPLPEVRELGRRLVHLLAPGAGALGRTVEGDGEPVVGEGASVAGEGTQMVGGAAGAPVIGQGSRRARSR